jgi:IrrE N-terminal-like domain
MRYVTITHMQQLLDELRDLPPRRPLTYGESLQLARVQAVRLRAWAGADDKADMNLLWLLRQRAVPVSFVPPYRLGEASGLTTDHFGGRLQVFINGGEPHQRQRFSLLHEFKHVLDFPDAARLHARLGSGNPEVKANMVEWVANEFAGHVLMPTRLIKRLWFQTQSAELMANLFDVSLEAMTTRLTVLGLIGEPSSAPRRYFRAVGLLEREAA